MKQLQQRNAQLIDNLRADFQHRSEPNFAWRAACSMFLALPGLRGFWPMSSIDYTAANRGVDESGQGNHLTDNNTVEFGYDSLAPYVHFTAVNNEYLSKADGGAGNWADILGNETEILNAYRGLTFGGWFYFDSLPGVNSSGIISKWISTTNNRSYVMIYNAATGQILSALSNTGAATAVSQNHSTIIATNQWYFLVTRFIPSTTLDIYVQNVLVSNAVGVPATLFDGTADFEIGRWEAAAIRTFDGRASMCFLCAAQLSDAIILSLFEQTKAMYNV